MSHPRYSIIPGGAVTDPRLEGRDLQVLCLLGRHTDKLGWCFRSQVKMAHELGCGRATLQRSLARLLSADWIDRRVEQGHSCYAYRVKIYQDDPAIGPSEYEVEDQLRERGCPQVGTPAHERAGGVPTYTRAHNDQEKIRGGVDARARDLLVSEEAIKTADEIAAIAGFPDPKNWSPGWCGAAMRVDAFLREGYHPQHLVTAAREVMAGNPNAKPWSIAYFEKAFARTKARAEAPIPTAENGGVDGAVQNGFAGRIDRKDDRSPKERRYQQAWDNVTAAFSRSGADDGGDGNEAHAPAARGLPKPRGA